MLINNDNLKNASVSILVALTLLFLLGPVGPAMAQSTLGGNICYTVITNLKTFATLFQWLAYTAGTVFVVMGIQHFKAHSESPQNNKIHTPIMLWAGGAALLALPSVIGAIVTSLYGVQGSGGATGWSCDQGVSSATGSGLDAMMVNFISNISTPIVTLVSLIAFLCGLWIMISGLMKASKYGFDPKTNSITAIATNILFGALLISIGDNLNMIMSSVFGNTTVSISAGAGASMVTSWTAVQNLGASPSFANAVGAALTFIQLIGVIAFVRGWLVLKKVAEGSGNASMAAGITHIVGGVLAINIFVFLQIMDNTFGTGLLGGS